MTRIPEEEEHLMNELITTDIPGQGGNRQIGLEFDVMAMKNTSCMTGIILRPL